MLATAAAIHCAAAANALSHDLWGYHRIATQPFSGLVMQDGAIAVPTGPGLGIAIDETGLELLAAVTAA